MRRLWLLASLAVLASGCSMFESTPAAPPELATSGLQSFLVPPPAEIEAKLPNYVRCLNAKQKAPQYASLKNKFFFQGAPPAAARDDESQPNDEEQVALAKWEVDRKECILMLADYVEFFSHFDKTQGLLLNNFQVNVRKIHDDLIKGQLTYGAAAQKDWQATQLFWDGMAVRNKNLRDFVVRTWLGDQPTS